MHDKNGKLISVGDKVNMTGTVVQCNSSGDGTFCTVLVDIEGDWDGKGNTDKKWFSAKEVEIVEQNINEKSQAYLGGLRQAWLFLYLACFEAV